MLNPLVQFDEEMIDCMIFGEFLENGDGVPNHQFRSSYLFFLHLKMICKKIHIKIMMICFFGKKN